MQWENASLKLGQLVSNPGSQCDTGGVDSILSSSKPWEADRFLLGGGLERTVLLELGIWGEIVPSHLSPLMVPASLPRLGLQHSIHCPTVHKILDDQ